MRLRRMGEVYSGADSTVTIAGMFDVNPSGMEYGTDYDHEYAHGVKREARGWRMGKKNMECKMTLPLDVVHEFEKIAPKGDIAKIRPFPINVVFTNSENEIITDVIIAKFKGNKRTISGDSGMENEYEMFPIDIQLNVTL